NRGYQGPKAAPSTILLKNNGLHLEIQIDSGHPIGKTDPAHVKDVFLESAITSIMDLEDSIAAVDAEEKVDVYRNWKGLVRGELSTTFKKGEELIERRFNPDRIYKSTSGETVSLRSEEHTSELQSRFDLVCRLLLEKNKDSV